MNYNDLTPEMKERVAACKSPEEILEIAKEEGYELSEEELDALAGGSSVWDGCDSLSGSW